MNYQIKRYGQTSAFNLCTKRNTDQNTVGGLFETIVRGTIYRSTQLQENQFWFFGGNWIPYGIYHDLMDNTNVGPNNATEFWDSIQNVTIQQLYNAHGPDVINMCEYQSNFITQNTSLNVNNVIQIFDRHFIRCN
jgi:hypothetical protein